MQLKNFQQAWDFLPSFLSFSELLKMDIMFLQEGAVSPTLFFVFGNFLIENPKVLFFN